MHLHRPFAVLLGIWLFCLASLVGAHPHVFIEGQYRIELDKTTIDSFEASWKFDLFTSSSLILEFDTNSDSQFQGQEKQIVADKLKSFEAFDFFMKVLVDGNAVRPSRVVVSDIIIQNQQILLIFSVAMPDPINLQKQTLSLSFGDDEFYFALMPPENGLLLLRGMLAETCTPNSREAEEMAIDSWADVSCD
ncbi:DUF1007 family protein [Marinomonas algicola]|uniref:DUF1007 family protein n=1 Tax=Marinomonas algicola TaxID=2773454 RepID=UPI001749A1EE|nr:DUF1007 family protein [Marinomonas algicola]